ncbi:hypothetical protein QFC22_004450 [Naganishia vaughanmartiniae]|uniref:Uncharacterized protein n=1 Tax=Naganishia vaughanmartiniae TaxID=1424756 RepID=A0ACC2X2I2_9TREE|nr:hypothetical protein QFC22_004450 [Naganishia vaughanmartiniae]
MMEVPPRSVLPPLPTEEDDEHAFDYDQYSRPDNKGDDSELVHMYSSQSSPFNSADGVNNPILATATPTHQQSFNVFDLPDPARFDEPELSFITTSTAESTRTGSNSGGSARNSGYIYGNTGQDGVRIRPGGGGGGSSAGGPSPIDMSNDDKEATLAWEALGRNRQRSESDRVHQSRSTSRGSSGASTPSGSHGMAPVPVVGVGISGSSSPRETTGIYPSTITAASSRPPLTLRTSSYSKPSSSEDFSSPVTRQISQLRTSDPSRPRSSTLSSITSNSSGSSSRPEHDANTAAQSDTSRRNSLHRSVLDRNSQQQFAELNTFIPRSATTQTVNPDKWLESDYETDADNVLSPSTGFSIASALASASSSTSRVNKRSNSSTRYNHPGTDWNRRYYGDSSFQSETEMEGHAVALVDDGKSRIIDAGRIKGWGGVTRLTERLENESRGQFDGGVIEEFDGATHLLLSRVGLGEQVIDLLSVLLPVVASTLVVLDLSSNLMLNLPPLLARCHSLEELNISENPLVSLPSWMGELTNLRMLIADGCGLKSLPGDMVRARLLHTICVRRNRMINLPSWLSQLHKLEMLLVDDNPFAGYWQQMIDTILIKGPSDIPPVPPLPTQFMRRPSDGVPLSSPTANLSPASEFPYSSSNNQSLSSVNSPRSISSTLSQSPYPLDSSRQASQITLSPNITHANSPSSSGFFGAYSVRDSPRSGVTSPVMAPVSIIPDSSRSTAHRFANDASRLPQGVSAPGGKPSKALKRMRSAGALLGLRSMAEEGHGAAVPPSPGAVETLTSQPTRRQYSSFGRQGNKQMAMSTYDGDLSSDGEDEPQRRTMTQTAPPSSSSTASGAAPNKTGKWGFLKKMSMSKMRGTTGTSSSRPGPPAHSVSDSAKLHKRMPSRPGTKGPQSAMTLPTMRGTHHGTAGVSEFGVTEHLGDASRDSRVTISSATVPVQSNTRLKRRSFLPILDTPPSLNIPIPSVAPFDAISFATSPAHARRALPTDVGPATSRSGSPDVRMGDPGMGNRTYDIGLKSIMSYLGDLYDLSLPIPVISAGAEVIHSDASGASGSISATSDPRSSSPAMAQGRGLPSVGRRSRRPTINADIGEHGDAINGNQSPLSMTDESIAKLQSLSISRPDSVAREAPEEPVHQKKYKDDPVVRAGVVKHILDTERSYVQGLRDLVDIYVKPAASPVKGSTETVIPQTERKIVFGGIEGILQFHELSFLPTLESAAKELLRNGDDPTGERSKRIARQIGEAFNTYHPFLRQYSTYINNFDFALSRLGSWTTISEKLGLISPSTSVSGSAIAAATLGVGLGLSVVGGTPDNAGNGSNLTPAQKKRIKHFMKACRKNPRHTQISLESYLLLPVQRIPRYRMLLDDLARSTPPAIDIQLDPIEEALQEMVALASTMNEEKRDAESRQRLVNWQTRIRGRFASPLVQAHRRLLLDGTLLLTRIVKRSSTFVEVSSSLVDDSGNNENTITNAKTIVQIEALSPEVPNRQLAAIVTSDLMILCKDPAMGKDPSSQVDLYAVLKMQTKRKPAMLLQGNGIRLVDNKAIFYLAASTTQEAANWVRIINNEFDPLR